MTVTVTNVGAQSGSLANGFTYNAAVPISFAQVASATPQITDRNGERDLSGRPDGGDLNVVVVGWNDTTATVQSVKDSAGNIYSLAIGPTSRDGVAAIDLLCGEHTRWQQHGDGDIQRRRRHFRIFGFWNIGE